MHNSLLGELGSDTDYYLVEELIQDKAMGPTVYEVSETTCNTYLTI